MRLFNSNEITFIQDRGCERITEILDALGIEYTERHDYIQCACPVHDGNNDRGLFWAMRSNHWQCKTRGCHKNPITGPSSSIFGLIRGTMKCKTEKTWSFMQAVNFVVHVLGLANDSINNDNAEDIEVTKLIKQYRKKQNTKNTKGILLSTITNRLKSDQVYYPNRGVSQQIIAKYHISFCNTKGKPMYKRAFFPILDITGRYVIGWSGRSIYEKCKKCNMYHHTERETCPDKKYNRIYTKWKHSKNLSSESCLYNIWYAKPFISKTSTIILCEGPGDVWALEMAGIRNSVALLGCTMSRQQRLIIQNAGALTIICVFDNDNAGMAAMEVLKKDLNCYFRIFCVSPEMNSDIADMVPDEIITQISPILEKVSRKNILFNNI